MLHKTITTAGAALLFAAAASAGMRYESVTVMYDDKGRAESTMKVEAWVDGDSARVEFEDLDGGQAKASGLQEDGYLITTDGGRTLFFVNPKDETYMEWDLAGLMQTAGELMNSSGGMVSFTFDNAEVENLGSEDGGTIHGLDTTKVERKTVYDMNMKVFGMKRSYHVETEQEMWLTTELPDAGFGAWLRAEPPKTGNTELDEMIAMQAEGVEGTPLKSVTLSRTTDKRKGRTDVTRTVQEVTAIEEVEIDPGRFVIPSNYERVEMPTMAGDDEAEDSKGLGGLLRSIGG